MAQVGEFLIEYTRWLRLRPGLLSRHDPNETVSQFLEQIEQKGWMPGKGPDLSHAGIVAALAGKWLGEEGTGLFLDSGWAGSIADALVTPDGDPTPEASLEGPAGEEDVVDIPSVVAFLEGVSLNELLSTHLRVTAALALLKWHDTVTYKEQCELDRAPSGTPVPGTTWGSTIVGPFGPPSGSAGLGDATRGRGLK